MRMSDLDMQRRVLEGRKDIEWSDWKLHPDYLDSEDGPAAHVLVIGCPDGGHYLQFLYDAEGNTLRARMIDGRTGNDACRCKYCNR